MEPGFDGAYAGIRHQFMIRLFLNVPFSSLVDCNWKKRTPTSRENRGNENAGENDGENDGAGEFFDEIEKFLKIIGYESIKEQVKKKVTHYRAYTRNLTHLEKVSARIHYISSGGGGGTVEKAAAEWGELSTGGVETYHGNGEHYLMFSGDSLEKNAGIINRVLEGI